MQNLATTLVARMLLYFSEVAALGYRELMDQLRSAWINPQRLPRAIGELFAGDRLSPVECGVLEAFVLEELQRRKERKQAAAQLQQPTSGVPPPPGSSLPQEPRHAA